jgi:hypothetical protein
VERPVGVGATAAVHCVGRTAHPTTTERLHEVVDDDVLRLYNGFLYATQRSLSAADLRHVVGYGSTAEQPSGVGPRRLLLWCSRLCNAGPRAALQGQWLVCLACGDHPHGTRVGRHVRAAVQAALAPASTGVEGAAAASAGGNSGSAQSPAAGQPH